jgi:hypothetical protein
MNTDRKLTFMAPRHPFRRSLANTRALKVHRNEDTDPKLFVLSFAAFFICFCTFIF